MEKMGKKIKNIPTKLIYFEFWRGVGKDKWLLFVAFFLIASAQIINIVIPIFYKDFFDIVSLGTEQESVVPKLIDIIVIVLWFHIIHWVFWRIAMYCYNKMQSGTMARLKQIAFDYTSYHSHTFFANNFGGSLVQKVNRFSRAFESLCDNLAFNFLPLVVVVLGSIVVTWTINPLISVVIFVWISVFVVFSIYFARWKTKFDLESAEADSLTTAYLSDAMTNNSAVASFTGEGYESQGFSSVSNDQAKKNFKNWTIGDMADAVQTLLIIAVEFLVFYYAIQYWERGSLTVGAFVLAQVYIISLSYQLWNLSRIIRALYQAIADSKEMVEILNTPYEIKDINGAKELMVKNGEIIFKDVSFGFGKNSHNTIDKINVSIKPKEKVAIIGHSGAGKTTFVRLLMRLYDVKSGQITIDGNDISKVTQKSLRDSISFVPQDPVLFHRTLMDNIRYGNRSASDEEVREAAKLAYCDEFIDKLPLKYETFVGERGIKLSGGERQRIAIARAILKNAPILIFDEATSSLDSYSESLIQGALENLMKNSTTIVIAHRLSTVKKMDRIIAMDEGKVIEEGTHEDLANKENGLYKKLWDLQVGGFV